MPVKFAERFETLNIKLIHVADACYQTSRRIVRQVIDKLMTVICDQYFLSQ